jgi:hypothetical protein
MAIETLLKAIQKANKKVSTSAKENAASWHDLLKVTARNYPLTIEPPNRKTTAELRRVVGLIIEQFQLLVEKKGHWKLLWITARKAAKEEVAQKVFFGIADSYCKANDLDVTPEANPGTGPVDFKFSKGSKSKVLVELKKSTNTKLVSSYPHQLEAYRQAEEADLAVLVVIEVDKKGTSVERLFKKDQERRKAGETVCDIVTIDGTRQVSASRRRD